MQNLRHRQTIAPLGRGMLRLPVSDTLRVGGVPSPYFHTIDARKVGTGRANTLNMKALINTLSAHGGGDSHMDVNFSVIDDSGVYVTDYMGTFDMNGLTHSADIAEAAVAATIAAAALASITITPADVSSLFIPTVGDPSESSLSLSVQTSTGAVGTQVSSTRDAWVSVNANVSTTASIGGNAAGDLVLEIAPTNSATAGDWIEKARLGNSQNLSLVLALQSVQVVKGQLFAFVPRGYYAKVRSVGFAGTTTGAISSARKILI